MEKVYSYDKSEKYTGYGIFCDGIEIFTLPVGHVALCKAIVNMLNDAFEKGKNEK